LPADHAVERDRGAVRLIEGARLAPADIERRPVDDRVLAGLGDRDRFRPRSRNGRGPPNHSPAIGTGTSRPTRTQNNRHGCKAATPPDQHGSCPLSPYVYEVSAILGPGEPLAHLQRLACIQSTRFNLVGCVDSFTEKEKKRRAPAARASE
jgi:hypothetical protein